MSDRSRVRPVRSSEAGSRTEPNTQLWQLTDKQRDLIKDLFPKKPPSKLGGRPRCDPRACFEAILWVLITGARWKDLPNCFPSKSTCHLRFKQWTDRVCSKKRGDVCSGRWTRSVKSTGLSAWVMGRFSSAKKGAIALVRPVAGRGPRSCFWSMETEFRSVWTSKQLTETKLF